MMHRLLLVITSIFISLALTIVPVPMWAVWLRPLWVPMVLCTWVILYPEWIGIGFAFVIGIFLDVLMGTMLGQHALLLSLITYVCSSFNRHLLNLPMWQQTLVIVLLMTFYMFGHCLIQSTWGHGYCSWFSWLSLLTTACFWSPLFLSCRHLVHRHEGRVF